MQLHHPRAICTPPNQHGLLVSRRLPAAGQQQRHQRCCRPAAAGGAASGGVGSRPLQQQAQQQQGQQQAGGSDGYDDADGQFWEGLGADDALLEEEHQPAEQQARRLRVEYARGHCYGCGVRLQAGDPESAGFVEPERYEVKRKHKQLGQLLCIRCQGLSNGAMIPAVADFAQREPGPAPAASAPAAAQQQAAAADAPVTAPQQEAQEAGAAAAPRYSGFADKALLTPEELRQKLKVVQQQRALVVLLVDLLDASGSILGRVRDLVGNNPIMLVGTKVDLLPPGTDPVAVAEWLAGAAAYKRINSVSVHLVSSKSGLGVPPAVAAIRRERRGRDVYVVGAANVGKSAFIRALVRDMSSHTSRQYDPLAQTRGRFLPVESAMPGTTLEIIPMEVFAAGGVLYDTPGLHLHHRVPHLLTPTENKQLHPRRKLRPYVPPSPSELLEATTADCSLPGSSAAGADDAGAPLPPTLPSCNVATYWWGGLAKIQVLACPPDTELAFYGPQALLVEASVEPADAPAASMAPPQSGSGDSSSGAIGSSGSSRGAFYMGSIGGASDSDDERQQGSATTARTAGAATAAAEEPQGFGAASVMRRGGLRPSKELTLRCPEAGGRQAIGDISVSGIPGWIAVHASSSGSGVVVRVWAPPGVEVFSRPPLPVPSPLAGAPAAVAPAQPAVVEAPVRQRPTAQQGRQQGGGEVDWW